MAAVLAVLSCGCVAPTFVQVLHVLPENKEIAAKAGAAQPMLVWILAPERSGSAEPPGGRNSLRPELRARRLGWMVARALSSAGVRVAAYGSSARIEGAAPALAALGPSGVLQISILSLDASASSRSGDPYEARAKVAARLLRHPSGELVDQVLEETVSVSHLPSGPGKGLAEWYEENESELFATLARRLAARYAAKPTTRQRPVLARFDLPDSARALDLARAGDWAGAEAVWTQRAASGGRDWRDELDLGVAAERRKDYSRALEHYEKAKAGGAQDPEGQGLPFDEMIGDMRWLAGGPSTAAAGGTPGAPGWFSKRLAVESLSDGSIGAQGPELVRDVVVETLEHGGYYVVSAGEPGAADLVLKGAVTEFDDLVGGAGGKRSVAGRLSLWDEKDRKELWGSRESVDSRAGPGHPILPPAVPLSPEVRARLAHSPLGYETQVFVERLLDSLPMKLPADAGSE